MTRFRLMLTSILVFALVAVVAVHAGRRTASEPSAAAPAPARSFEFTYQVHVPANADSAGPTHLWIPLPQADGYQDIRGLRIDSPVNYVQGRDPEYANAFATFAPTMQQSAAGFDAVLRFTAVRREHKVALDAAALQNVSASAPSDPHLQRYLEPDKLVPLNGIIAELAKEHTAGDTTPIQKARHIYDYVLATMRYDKTGEGWGRGDAIWACTAKRGNCTDFHSLFIGMVRSAGIPARFEIGFPLPADQHDGAVTGYHCWAQFYVQPYGWIPVDASEAWKHPEKKNYFFGAHDDNRLQFTVGRDIRLDPPQQGDPLNYFIYPYAELDGKPFPLESKFSFQDRTSSSD